MQRRKRLPTISPKQTEADFAPGVRRRNLSLSSKYERELFGLADTGAPCPPARVRLQTVARSYSRKNKLFLFSEKARRARDLTKLCQENVSEYLQLKQAVAGPPAEPPRKPSARSEGEPFEASPKLSIKLLNVPLSLAFPVGRSSPRLRIKTETSPTRPLKLRSSFEACPSRPAMKPAACPLSPKRYNQLTLREIVESEESEVSERLQLFQKVKWLKERLRESVGVEARDEEPLKGW